MPLNLASIIPHPPILIPSIGKENQKHLAETLKSYKKISQELKDKKVETIVIISPHGLCQETSFTMNLNPDFEANFEEFGDFSTKKNWAGDVALAYKIREKLETKASLQLISEKNLDYGASVPLFILTDSLPEIKIIPVYYSGLSNQDHFDFGKLLGSEIAGLKEQIAVIVSGDLSHALTKNSPGGYSPKGKKFDKKIIELLLAKKTKEIVNLDVKLIQDAEECGLKGILILLGILEEIKNEPQLLSYESPFGVGYLAMNFKI